MFVTDTVVLRFQGLWLYELGYTVFTDFGLKIGVGSMAGQWPAFWILGRKDRFNGLLEGSNVYDLGFVV